MTGTYSIVIQNKHVKYEFEVKRKYTVIRGDSATGKTYMCRMINEPAVIKVCDRKLSVLPNSNWDVILAGVSGQIFFADESFADIASEKFAEAMEKSDNYFVLITRLSLPGIPCSDKDIYSLISEKRYDDLNKPYILTELRNH